MLELTRLYVIDETPKNTESYFIGHCLRWLKRNTKLDGIISYADPNVGHQGVIYRASNFKFLGKTKGSYHYLKDGKRLHIRQVWDRSRKNGVTERVQAESENLVRVSDAGKNIYFYKFNQKIEDPSVAMSGDHIYRENFFSKWSRESAWAYGLILGDGNVALTDKGGRISLVGNLDNSLRTIQLIG